MPLLEAKGVTKRFGGLIAVQNVDYFIEPHTINAIIGPNGAGKTTFFNLLTGIYTPDEGKIIFDGKDITGLKPNWINRAGIARTFQNIRLFGAMTVIENCLVGMHPRLNIDLAQTILRLPAFGQQEREAQRRAENLLEFVGLRDKANEVAKNLPYGDQRRLEIARALASEPKLLLLDEPTAGMNPQESAAAMQLFRAVRDKFGITVLLIEHDMRVVMGISERVTVLDYGQKIAEGTPEEVRRNPQVIEAYLGRGSAASHI
ncbi:MAG: ABC transporter ATP-binding protein [Candidatus Thermofonsia Clade 1 bacterium]|jgi:branched-chain amino acid transport system ATP-binding protein|uniref:ABC transporter ATP-binding protein n=1 Tax=Candidatus Thermofonsia Clade 1 bacterium TaxID=2364210 RepID=A0A2M8Q0Q7_9CHLR|nr:MAG: ABC transporter ATP-binding protein [Candidatus Thermofonsia Clade 1 bacterium]PJF43397.1 MAG: ABC transporter ATP-binding protein [Candidatus Thermofonsia Clade 1 bacterium]RMF52236.1 MAG: ABC transporter ATP-binding protein [Chloroflexota bacterium]